MAQYGNNKRRLKGLTAEEREKLKWLSYACRALYNTSLGFVRAEIDQNGLPAYSATHRAVIRTTEEYRRLGEAYESVSDLARVNCVVSIRTKRPLPAEKDAMMTVVLNWPETDGGRVCVPATEGTPEMWLPLPELAKGRRITAVQICPFQNGDIWEINARYRLPEPPHRIGGEVLGIDFGVENFATLACSNGKTLIIDGRRLKSILRGDYKRRQRGNYSVRDEYRHRCRVEDYVCKSASVVLDFCKKNDVRSVLIGKGNTVSKLRNQCRVCSLWPDFPFDALFHRVQELCQREGIRAEAVNETYTSKASFLDNDEIPPKFIRKPPTFSGVRRYRGLYVSKKSGRCINADVNGAFNILRKHHATYLAHLQNKPSEIQTPQRIDPLTYKPNARKG